MSLTRPSYPSPQRNRSSAILTTSILVAFFLLIGLSWFWFGIQHGVFLAPTPTATATSLPATLTPTPDVRATNVAGDMLTQVAFSATALANLTPQPGNVTGPESPLPADALVTQSSIRLPIISSGNPPETPVAQPESPLGGAPTATVVFVPDVTNPTAPTLIPTATLFVPPAVTTAAPLITPQIVLPTDTPTPPIVQQPTFTPSPTVLFIQVSEMGATSRSVDTPVYIGPSTFYTQTGTLASNTSIRLRGRTQSGDWLFGCCINTNQNFWVRPAYVTISGNPTPVAFPQGVDINTPQWDPNNPRWLPSLPADPSLALRPQPTPIPFGDYPLARYDRTNSGRLAVLPRPPLQSSWGGFNQAAQPFRSPVAVSGQNVLSSSSDGQFYSLNRDSGTQRWRFSLNNSGELAPAINDGRIYVPYAGNRIYVMQDAGNAANPVSDIDLPGNASTSPTFLNDVVFVGAGDGADARLVAMKRDNLSDRRLFEEPQSRLLQPAIGQETIYVPANRLWALDVNLWQSIEQIWVSADVANVAAPPVYITPGAVRNAELYVADGAGNVFALDANTGARIWSHPFGGQVTMMAVNDTHLFIAGGGILRAITRLAGQTVWNAQTNGALAGGPWVTADRVMVASQSGSVLFYDAATGAVVDAATNIGASVAAAPAVSQEWLFIPSGSTVFGFRGTP